MKTLQVLTIAVLIILGFSGCEKPKTQNDASADVYIRAIKNSQGVTVYAPIHSVFSYNKMSEVSVKAPGGSILQLTNFQNGGNSFYNEPATAEYSTTIPTPGQYTYTVKFDDGEEKTYSNSLSSSVMAPANITSLTKTANGDSVYVSWDAIANVDFYQLLIQHGTIQVFYAERLFDNSNPKKANLRLGFSIVSLMSSGSGTYTFELIGKLYESTSYDYLQAISPITKEINL